MSALVARNAEFGIEDSAALRHKMEEEYCTQQLEGKIDDEAMKAAFLASPTEEQEERFLTIQELLAPDPNDDLSEYIV